MIDKEQETGGKINWPVAVTISLAAHAALLGAVWFLSAPSVADAPGAVQQAEPAVSAPQEPERAEVAETPGGQPESATAPTVAEPARPVASGDGQPPAPAASGTYKVRPGDSLSRIANKHGCTVAELADMNGIPVNKMLGIGETLKVPAQRR